MKAIQTANSKGGSLRFNLKNNHYIKLLSNINRTGLFSAFTFLLLALTCLFPISKGEQNTEAVTGTVQSSSLTLNVSSSAASVELDVNSNTGTFASSTTDNSAAFSVTTNNFSGYTLTISGNDDEGKLYDSTKQNFLTSLANATSETDFSSTLSLNGKWGYKPSKFNSALNDNYLPAPTTEASTLDKTAAANTTANDYSISLGLRADYTTTADTYSNSFIITAVPNPIAYVITYDANTTDTVSNMPVSQNSTTSATEITLSDKTPAREGYDFKGWCTTAPTTTNPDVCTGTTFQPGDTYGIDQTSENITTLYAMWEEQIAGYIQDYTYTRCSSEAASKAVKLMDKRDDKVYTARYINGLCTMIDNLDFALTSGMTLSPDTTNVTTSRTLGTVGSLTAGNSDDEPRTARNSNITGAGLHYNYAAATAGTITGSSNSIEATQDICPAGWRLPTGGQNQEQFILNNSYTWQQWNSNFPTAFAPVAAGYYNNGSLSSSGSYGVWWSSTASSTTVRYSLNYNTSNGLLSGSNYYRDSGRSVRCVKAKPGMTISFNANGGTGTMDMQKIDAGQSANLMANTFTRTDYVFTGWNTKPDGSGTSYSNAATYTAPASEDNKIVVLYAQWVPAMQSFTSSQCQSQATNAPVTVIDSRDNKSYKVRYINGVCTMIDNLAISPGTTITGADSNIGNWAYTIPGELSYSSYMEGSAFCDDHGCYYNYFAATAGTIEAMDNSADATVDICPNGWSLPTYSQQSALTGTNYITVFSPIQGVSWWSSTASEYSARYALGYNDNYIYNFSAGRDGEYSIRCIAH